VFAEAFNDAGDLLRAPRVKMSVEVTVLKAMDVKLAPVEGAEQV